jgi:hypothetical protein
MFKINHLENMNGLNHRAWDKMAGKDSSQGTAATVRYVRDREGSDQMGYGA